jgi:hypothetical protein
MKPRSDTNVFNWNNFVMLVSAAYAAAKYENPSMRNYSGGQETAAGGHVDNVVTTYLSVRTSMSISSIIQSPHAYLRICRHIQATRRFINCYNSRRTYNSNPYHSQGQGYDVKELQIIRGAQVIF